jgi:hypothetical protein
MGVGERSSWVVGIEWAVGEEGAIGSLAFGELQGRRRSRVPPGPHHGVSNGDLHLNDGAAPCFPSHVNETQYEPVRLILFKGGWGGLEGIEVNFDLQRI